MRMMLRADDILLRCEPQLLYYIKRFRLSINFSRISFPRSAWECPTSTLCVESGRGASGFGIPTRSVGTRSMIKWIFFSFSLFAFSFEPLHAQSRQTNFDTSYLIINYGGFFDWNFNMHSADFKKLPGVPNC